MSFKLDESNFPDWYAGRKKHWKGKHKRTCKKSGIITKDIEADMGDTIGLVPDHYKKVNIAIKQIMQIFRFLIAYKSYVYTLL